MVESCERVNKLGLGRTKGEDLSNGITETNRAGSLHEAIIINNDGDIYIYSWLEWRGIKGNRKCQGCLGG